VLPVDAPPQSRENARTRSSRYRRRMRAQTLQEAEKERLRLEERVQVLVAQAESLTLALQERDQRVRQLEKELAEKLAEAVALQKKVWATRPLEKVVMVEVQPTVRPPLTPDEWASRSGAASVAALSLAPQTEQMPAPAPDGSLATESWGSEQRDRPVTSSSYRSVYDRLGGMCHPRRGKRRHPVSSRVGSHRRRVRSTGAFWVPDPGMGARGRGTGRRGMSLMRSGGTRARCCGQHLFVLVRYKAWCL
jgi:hypothetical protein